MKKIIILFSIIFIFVSLPIFCVAYEDSMVIAGVNLKLGMPKDKVLDILHKTEYHIGSPTGETYSISKKKGELYDYLGYGAV